MTTQPTTVTVTFETRHAYAAFHALNKEEQMWRALSDSHGTDDPIISSYYARRADDCETSALVMLKIYLMGKPDVPSEPTEPTPAQSWFARLLNKLK